MIKSIEPKGTSSSSAATWIVAVATPVPCSSLPVKIVTLPFPPIATQESSRAGSTGCPIGKSFSRAAKACFGFKSRGAPIATTSAPAPAKNLRRL
jgi:hypothetical protein